MIAEDSSVLRASAECTTVLSSSRLRLPVVAIARGEGSGSTSVETLERSRVIDGLTVTVPSHLPVNGL